MTAKQDKQLQQQQGAARSIPPPPRPERSSGAESVIPNPEPCKGTQPKKQADGGPSARWPNCAPYFSSLIKASWGYFGWPPSSIKCSFDMIETGNVYRALKSRLLAIDVGRRYTQLLQEGMSNKMMSPEEFRAYASRRVIYEAGREDVDPTRQRDDLEVAEFVRGFDRTITLGLRWQDLLDAVGVPEVLLIHYDNEETDFWEDIPFPDVELVSDKEWPFLLNGLLSPSLGLKEACLRLSGVADMIQRLKGLDESELRTYLAVSIQQRVKGVLGDEKSLPDYECDGEDDESMADADSNHDADTPLYGSEAIDFSRV